MPVNTLTFNQLSTVLNAIVSQATGVAQPAAVSTEDFVSLARIGLQTGYDPLATAISQVLSRTIFSTRAYTRKLRFLEADAIRYGNHVRKLQEVDDGWDDDDRLLLVDGQSIDQYEVKKPKVVQTNFYGANVFQKFKTFYKDQLDSAFTGPDQFQSFLGMYMQNAQNQIEQAHEETSRYTLLNLIGGTALGQNAPQVVHLVTMYNAEIGSPSPALNLADLLAPDKFPDFARFIFAVIKTTSQALEDRTVIYHTNPTTASPVSGYIPRHTPVQDQRLILFGPIFNRIDANVLSVTFNDEYLRLLPHEFLSYWQNPNNKQYINVEASYTDTAGAIQTGTYNNTITLGVLFDREAAGYTTVNEWAQPTPMNARGGYYNQFWHFTDRYWNDNSENCVVFQLD